MEIEIVIFQFISLFLLSLFPLMFRQLGKSDKSENLAKSQTRVFPILGNPEGPYGAFKGLMRSLRAL